jgi:hypothetical protein
MIVGTNMIEKIKANIFFIFNFFGIKTIFSKLEGILLFLFIPKYPVGDSSLTSTIILFSIF